MYGSATESDSEASKGGYEFHVEEIESGEKDSNADEDERRLTRTMHEGESTDDEKEEMLEDEIDEDVEENESNTDDTSDFEDVTPAPSGSDYSNFYEEEDWESYNEDN
ncbi:guanine nucleotide-binding protein-like 3 homolog [Papaver somniferum]|uniref:guanine nucleotide-binding protein-like 3 homolog n=1 Tax=Papaver somniferum TaxID=3469 RepID=UPI000E6FBF72|nr:guanine nucleotide-binding protein-like 3 homolog [Papaver somniferum]